MSLKTTNHICAILCFAPSNVIYCNVTEKRPSIFTERKHAHLKQSLSTSFWCVLIFSTEDNPSTHVLCWSSFRHKMQITVTRKEKF